MKMLNLLVLITMGTWLSLGISSPLGARDQATNSTNAPAATGELASPKEFQFPSGDLKQFIRQIGELFGINLWDRADIRGEMGSTHVPSMRIRTSKLWDVLDLYNRISEDYPGMGKWVIIKKGSSSDNGAEAQHVMVNSIFLVPPKPTDGEADRTLTVRAFSLTGLSDGERTRLAHSIDDEAVRLNEEVQRGFYPQKKWSYIIGYINFNQRADILVAKGDKTYVELVSAIVEVFRERNRIPSVAEPAKPKSDK